MAVRVTRVEGGRVYGRGAVARVNTMAASEAAFPKGTRFVKYTGELTGDLYRDSTSLSRFTRTR